MNIRTRFTWRFSLIVASILIVFSASVYVQSDINRRLEFTTRLENRAISTARLLFQVQEVDSTLLQTIEKNSLHVTAERRVLVYDPENKLVYNSVGDHGPKTDPKLLDRIRRNAKVSFSENGREALGMKYSADGKDYVVIASGYDRYGEEQMRHLRNIMLFCLLVGTGIIALAGRIFVQQALEPLARIKDEILTISSGNLDQRVYEGDKHDEFAQLARDFNQMLERLQAAFKMQQQFVSNAAHELRTPLAVITSQIQAILQKKRSQEEYRQVLQSLFDDAHGLANLTNGLLLLAKSEMEEQRRYFKPVRVDEAIFSAQMELRKNSPDYRFQIEYNELPDEDDALKIMGDDQLLKTAFLNLMDNACKFSSDRTVQVRVSFPDALTLRVCFSDRGPGIPVEEREKIFEPFYRSVHLSPAIKGYGIGLSLCQRIVQLHEGTLRLEISEQQTGSCFVVYFPQRAAG